MNNINFLYDVWSRLDQAGISTWIFGGWAKELLVLITPRAHSDIDLLYPAKNLDLVDFFIATNSDVTEIKQKKFFHKRAFEISGIKVEIILVNDYKTLFFGAYIYKWPQSTFCLKSIASSEAIRDYESNYKKFSYGKALGNSLILS